MEQLTAEEIRTTADNWRRALEAITAPDTWQAEMIAAIEAQPWPPIAAEWHLEAEAWPELDTDCSYHGEPPMEQLTPKVKFDNCQGLRRGTTNGATETGYHGEPV